MFKRCKVVMLQSKVTGLINSVQTNLAKHLGIEKHLTYNQVGLESLPHTSYELYIISDDDIKEGELEELLEQGVYFESDNSMIRIITTHRVKTIGVYKKIIATTDNSLRVQSSIRSTENNNYGKLVYIIPQPSNQFIQKYIEEYNKGNVITDILVEYEDKRIYSDDLDMFGSTNIILKVNPKDNTITIKRVKDSWSREDLDKVLESYRMFVWKNGCTKEDLEVWKEQNL